jgi:hypothetical protein
MSYGLEEYLVSNMHRIAKIYPNSKMLEEGIREIKDAEKFVVQEYSETKIPEKSFSLIADVNFIRCRYRFVNVLNSIIGILDQIQQFGEDQKILYIESAIQNFSETIRFDANFDPKKSYDEWQMGNFLLSFFLHFQRPTRTIMAHPLIESYIKFADEVLQAMKKSREATDENSERAIGDIYSLHESYLVMEIRDFGLLKFGFESTSDYHEFRALDLLITDIIRRTLIQLIPKDPPKKQYE